MPQLPSLDESLSRKETSVRQRQLHECTAPIAVSSLRILLVGEHFRATIVRPMATFSRTAREQQPRRRLERAASFGSIETEQDRCAAFPAAHT